MPRLLFASAALLISSALAAGGQALSPLGVPYSDTHTLRCQSGRTVLFFSPNTQFVRLFYRGAARGLGALNLPATQGDYSDVGLRSMGQQFDTPKLGPGLEWRSTARSGFMWNKAELYRVVQHPDGRRTLTLLERCQG